MPKKNPLLTKRNERQARKMTDEEAVQYLDLHLQRGANAILIGFHEQVATLKKFKHKFTPEQYKKRYDDIRDRFDNWVDSVKEAGNKKYFDEAIKELGALPDL